MTPSEWLKANDKQLWVERPKMRDALNRCREETDEKISMAAFRELRDEHCEFWFQKSFKRPSTIRALSEREWSKISVFLQQHWPVMQGQTVDFVIRYMRLNRIPASEHILDGCQTYKDLCSGRMQ